MSKESITDEETGEEYCCNQMMITHGAHCECDLRIADTPRLCITCKGYCTHQQTNENYDYCCDCLPEKYVTKPRNEWNCERCIYNRLGKKKSLRIAELPDPEAYCLVKGCLNKAEVGIFCQGHGEQNKVENVLPTPLRISDTICNCYEADPENGQEYGCTDYMCNCKCHKVADTICNCNKRVCKCNDNDDLINISECTVVIRWRDEGEIKEFTSGTHMINVWIGDNGINFVVKEGGL